MINNILLAEDDRGIALVVRKQLESRGYRVYVACDGVEAIKVLYSTKIDLIITDVVMPRMDGVDLYEIVKSDTELEHIPIIIITDKAIFKESFARLGVSYFVEKSTDISNLLSKIENANDLINDVKRYNKILLCSENENLVMQMKDVLHGLDYLIAAATKADQVMSKAIVMMPHIILIDVLFEDRVSASELIQAIRCFAPLKNTKIVTYSYFADKMDEANHTISALEIAIDACAQAGADKYIGRFNKSFFLEKILDSKLELFK